MHYFFIDIVSNSEEAVNFPTEFLNLQRPSGMPSRKIYLKIGVPIILLRNVNSPTRLCNWTRLRVTSLTKSLIVAEILIGCAMRERLFLPKIPLYANNFPIQFRRVQFLIKIYFVITINKAQGKTLVHCGTNLENNFFSHVQLCVAFFWVGKPDNLYVYAQK